jgi:hypothetical protein
MLNWVTNAGKGFTVEFHHKNDYFILEVMPTRANMWELTLWQGEQAKHDTHLGWYVFDCDAKFAATTIYQLIVRA